MLTLNSLVISTTLTWKQKVSSLQSCQTMLYDGLNDPTQLLYLKVKNNLISDSRAGFKHLERDYSPFQIEFWPELLKPVWTVKFGPWTVYWSYLGALIVQVSKGTGQEPAIPFNNSPVRTGLRGNWNRLVTKVLQC